MAEKKMRIGIFCGASSGKNPRYIGEAQKIARWLVENNFGIVYGGAAVGIMGEIANTAMELGGEVIGVMPKSLFTHELVNKNVTELIVVDGMHERKEKMYSLSNSFLTLPGGMGTLDETFEILTWAQIGIHRKPCYMYNYLDYYEHLNSFLDVAVQEGFLSEDHRKLCRSVKTFKELTNVLLSDKFILV